MQTSHLCLSLTVAIALAACQSSPSSSGHATDPTATAATASPPPAAAPQLEVAEPRSLDVQQPPGPPMAAAATVVLQAQQADAVAPAVARLSYAPVPTITWLGPAPVNREQYANLQDNPVQRASEQPLSTFSIDVDTGSYSNVRRMLRQGQRPPSDAVRAEEFINYFDYQHPAPSSREQPFRVTTELAPAPWNPQRQLLMIGIKGYDIDKATLPASNLVLLLDTSGSMDAADKLPLLKQALALLVPQLRAQDRVSIVVYAGSAGLVLPPTPGDQHARILAALDRLQAGGSTNGGDGIALAYATARQAFITGGSNRIILATDGDFNVGTVSQDALQTLVADQRKSGIALTTLGFGQGNYNDQLAEQLADAGDGSHAYIDTLQEARKVLVDEMQSTLLTIAQDVKIQVEFNPAAVAEYRLIGYQNRLLATEAFANDKVDAGDIGAGHEVTALYEITPVGSTATRLPALRYRDNRDTGNRNSAELAHLRLRYKLPGQSRSRLIETPINAASLTRQPGESFRFASAVAAYADLLRGGEHIDQWHWNEIASAARSAQGRDAFGLRAEMLQLIDQARALAEPADSVPLRRTVTIAGD